MYKKTKDSRDFTDTAVNVYHRLIQRYGGTARISNMFELFKEAYGIDEYMVLDPKTCQNGPFESYLMDELMVWLNGDEVDMSEIYKSILEAGDFTLNEKRLFEIGKPEERIWAIFLAISDPANTSNIKLNND